MTLPGVRIEPESLACRVVAVDRFGNVQLSARPADLEEAGLAEQAELCVRAAGWSYVFMWGRTFAEVAEGGGIVFADSAGMLSLAVNRGSAAEALALGSGDRVVLTAPPAAG